MTLLIDDFKQSVERVYAKIRGPLLRSGMNGIRLALGHAEFLYFAETTMKMVIDKFNNYEKTVEEVMGLIGERNINEISQKALTCQGAWIQFHKPLQGVSAMFCFIPSVYLETGKDQVQVYLIDEKANMIDIMECNIGEAWYYNFALHSCATCKMINDLCPPCRKSLVAFSQVFAICAIIAGQYLAARVYEEKVFKGMRHIEREHSKGKARRVPVQYNFKVIDASRIILPLPSQDTPRSAEIRESWLEKAMAEGGVAIVERRTRPFGRTYHSDRYKESGLQGKTIYFPEGVVQKKPMRKENVDRQDFTKIVASDYGEEA